MRIVAGLGLLLVLPLHALGAQEPAQTGSALAATPPAAAAAAGSVGADAAPTTAVAAAVGLTEAELHERLRELKTVMEQALNQRDIEAILARVDEQVVFTTMNGDVVTGRDGVRAYFERMMNGPKKIVESVQVSFVPEALSILHGGDTAITWGHTDDHYQLAAGQSFDIQARWSGTMVLRDGQWMVANFHYSTNMFDNPVLQAQRRALLIGAAALGLVLGLLGYALGRRSGRRAA